MGGRVRAAGELAQGGVVMSGAEADRLALFTGFRGLAVLAVR